MQRSAPFLWERILLWVFIAVCFGQETLAQTLASLGGL